MSSYVDALSISQSAGDAEHGGVADPGDAAWIVRVGNAAGGTEHVLKIGCQQPARLDVALVDDLEQGLAAAHRAYRAGEDLGVAIEVAGGVRDPHVGDRHPEAVEGASGDKPDEADAAIDIEVDQVPIRRTVGDPAERGDAGQRGRYAAIGHRWRSVACLLQRGEDSEIAAELGRDAASIGIGDRLAQRGEALIIEGSEVIPAARGDVAAERPAADIDIVVKANLADGPRRIVDAKGQPVIAAKLGAPVNTLEAIV